MTVSGWSESETSLYLSVILIFDFNKLSFKVVSIGPILMQTHLSSLGVSQAHFIMHILYSAVKSLYTYTILVLYRNIDAVRFRANMITILNK